MDKKTIVNKRYEGFDISKCIAAFLVICIHQPFPGEVGKCVVSIARVGVPIFFMITGYFYNSIMQRKYEMIQIKKILFLFISANVFYFILNLLLMIFKGSVVQYLNNCFTFKNIFLFVFFNESPFGGHLWYLGAILYVLIIV